MTHKRQIENVKLCVLLLLMVLVMFAIGCSSAGYVSPYVIWPHPWSPVVVHEQINYCSIYG